jgi:replicative DNA helicase
MSEKFIERPVPQSLEAERSVLGAWLMDNNAILVASQIVSREDFFLPQHRLIFTAGQLLAAAGTPVEIVTLGDELQKSGDLEAAGGQAYLSALVDGMPKVSNVSYYAKIVKEKAVRRKVIHACHEIQEQAFSGKEDELLGGAASQFLSMMSQEGAAAMPSTWDAAVVSAMEEIVEAIRHPGNVMRWNFGLHNLDGMTGGWRRQDLNLLVGMTSHGKSLLAMQGAVSADNAGYKGLIFSAEMSKEALAKRELAHAADVSLYQLRRPEGIRDPDALIRDLMEGAVRERTRKLLVVDRDIKPSRVWSLCELVHRGSGLDFVVVDYDQLVIRAGLRMRDDEFRAQAEFMADALALCKRLNICFVLLCQPRKVDDDVANGRRPPRVEQIFGSSAVANTAHNVLWVMREYFLHGMDEQHENLALAYILKARNDKTGSIKMGFDSNRVLFTNERIEPPSEAKEETAKQREKREEKERGQGEMKLEVFGRRQRR